jgi:hypothetical protein
MYSVYILENPKGRVYMGHTAGLLANTLSIVTMSGITKKWRICFLFQIALKASQNAD